MFTITWEEFSLFLKVEKRHSQKPGAVQANHSRFIQISRWFTGKEWNRTNFRAFMAELESRGLSQETLNKFISFAKMIDDFLGVEETKGFKTRVPKLKRVTGVLSPAEIRAMAEFDMPYKKFKEFLNKRQRALLMVMGGTGCRISELLELGWENVKDSPRKHLLFVKTKNGSDREVVLNDELWDLIQALPRQDELVFPSARNGVLSSTEINTDIKHRAEAVGINKRVHNHLFRHSWATTMKQMKVPDSDICLIAGWTDPKMLLRYDGSQLDYIASKMQLHPLMRHSMTELEKIQKVIDDARLWFSPETHKISPTIEGSKITLTIKQL